MLVTQVASIANEALTQSMGEHEVLKQDLSNVVEVGKTVLNANGLDNFVRALPDVVGKFYFTSDAYKGFGVGIKKDSWEYGAALARIKAEMPIAVANEVWELEDGHSYDPNVFHKPQVSAKYWQDRNAFDVEISIAKDQAKSCFNSAEQLNALVSAIFTECENTITIALQDLELLTLDTLIAMTINEEFSSGVFGTTSGIRAIDPFVLYKGIHKDTTLTPETCLDDENFLEFLAEQMANIPDKLKNPSVCYNISGKRRFTPESRLNVILLSQLEKKFDIYLKSKRFHEDLVALPGHRTIPYWQGEGKKGGAWEDVSKINVKQGAIEIEMSNILGVFFDDRAAMITNESRETDVNYNGKARFYNYFYHVFNGQLVDTDFSCVVFFIAPTSKTQG